MKIKLHSYKLLFRLLDLLSNSKWFHKLVINPKIYLGASIITLSLMGNSCSSDKVEPKETENKKDSTIDNLKGNDIPQSKKDSISKKTIKSKTAGQEITIEVACYAGEVEPENEIEFIGTVKKKQVEDKMDTFVNLTCYVETVPSFKGSDLALYQYLDSNIIRPQGTDSISGTVYIEFIIEETGEITNVKIKRGIHPLLDAEALRVVKNMPDWVYPPNYKPHSDIQFILPIKFIAE